MKDKDVEVEGRLDGIAVMVEVFDPSLPRSDALTASDSGGGRVGKVVESVQNPCF